MSPAVVRVATYARQFHTLTQIIDGTLGSMVEDMDRESDVWFQLLERIEQQRLSAVSSSSSSLDSAYSSPGPPGKPLVSSSSVSTSISGLPATGHSRSTSGRLVRRSASGLSLSASSAQRSSYTSFSQIISAGGGVAGGDENIFHTGAASPSSLTSSVVDNPQPSENLQASSNISDSQKHVGNSLLAAFETPSNPGHSNDKQTSHAHRRDAWLVEEEHPLELFAEGMALILPELLTDQVSAPHCHTCPMSEQVVCCLSSNTLIIEAAVTAWSLAVFWDLDMDLVKAQRVNWQLRNRPKE